MIDLKLAIALLTFMYLILSCKGEEGGVWVPRRVGGGERVVSSIISKIKGKKVAISLSSIDYFVIYNGFQ